jgi:molybdate transport system permease protein
MDFDALVLTLRLAALTTVVLMVVATPLAAWIASGRGWERRVVQAAVALPLVLPPTVLGFYLLVGMGPRTAVGRMIDALLGHTPAFTFGGLVAASVVYSLPFAVQPLVVGFQGVDRELVETARVMGAGPWTAFLRIVMPLTKMSFGTAIVLTFAHTVGEFGVVLMVGGDIPGVTRTLSIAIFDRVQEGMSFVALLFVYGKGKARE